MCGKHSDGKFVAGGGGYGGMNEPFEIRHERSLHT
jgi:hypothetical protein